MRRSFLLKLARNAAGVLLILLGGLLGFVPFLPGIVFGILGITLLDFPGKRRLLRRLGSLPPFARLRRRSPAVARLWREMIRERGREHEYGHKKPRLTREKPVE